MVVTTGSDRARWASRLRVGVLALVALLSAHTAIYAAQYGLGDRFADAMSGSGHDVWWIPASVLILVVGFIVLLHVLGVVTSLEAAARRVRQVDTTAGDPGGPGFGPEVLGLWRRLFSVVAVAFAVQENVEFFLSHRQVLGLDALIGPDYSLALPMLALVTLALSALGAVVRWRIAGLRARVAIAARAIRARLADDVAARRWRIIGELAPRARMLVRRDAGRAPPLPLRS